MDVPEKGTTVSDTNPTPKQKGSWSQQCHFLKQEKLWILGLSSKLTPQFSFAANYPMQEEHVTAGERVEREKLLETVGGSVASPLLLLCSSCHGSASGL